MVEFLRTMEERHNKTHTAVIELVHSFDLGDCKTALDADNKILQKASRKRKQVYGEPSEGCNCHKQDKQCRTKRCPCVKAGKACVAECRCTEEFCQNPSGCVRKQYRRSASSSLAPTEYGTHRIHFPSNKRADSMDRSWRPGRYVIFSFFFNLFFSLSYFIFSQR